MVLGVIYPAPVVVAKMDLTAPWFHSEGGIMIPIPKPAVNITALLKPWTLYVKKYCK